MVSFLESVHLNAGYHREQSLAPFYFTFKTLHRMYADDIHITYADVDGNSIQLNLNHHLANLNK